MNPLKLTSISAILEYYDFAIFALLANFISQHFFPSTAKHIADLATFSIFALGYFVRPLGGIIFGILGDHLGRKKTFLTSILLMAFSTFCMGLLPTYAQVGALAPLLFIFFRIVQGVSYGAELPGSLTFLIEHIAAKHRSTMVSIMISCITFGSAISSMVIFLCQKIFTPSAMQQFGWRVPFLLGGLLAIVGYLVRKKTTETPYFINLRERPRFALLELLRHHLRSVIAGIGLIILPAAMIIFYISLPSFLSYGMHYESKYVYLLMTVGNLWTTLMLPLWGLLNDKFNRRKLLCVMSLIFMVSIYPLFMLLKLQSVIGLLLFVMFYQTLLAALAAGYFATLAENFPTSVRFTGTAFCYNFAHVIASLTPMMALALYQRTSGVTTAAWIFIIFAAIMLAGVIGSTKKMEDII